MGGRRLVHNKWRSLFHYVRRERSRAAGCAAAFASAVCVKMGLLTTGTLCRAHRVYRCSRFLWFGLPTLCLLLISCHLHLSEPEARRAAEIEFSQVCDNFHYDKQSFSGPSLVGNSPPYFQYEWTYV